MKTKIVVPLLFLLLLPARYLRAQSLDGAVDARADASLTVDAARSDAATGGAGGAAGGAAGATGAKDAGAAHDAAPPPPIKFFFNEAPGCSIGGSAGPGSHGGLPIATALVAAAILRRRRRDGGSARI